MIRRVNLNDIELLQRIGRKTFNDAFGNTCTKEDMREVLESNFNSEQLTNEIKDEDDHYFFFEEDGIVKGYMRINAKHGCPDKSFQNRKCIELVRLYILEEFHGTGVANQLMDFAEELARKNSFDLMFLSVWEYNFRARGFYEKHGFSNSGIKNDFPLGSTPQTDYWFVKDL